MIPRWIRIALYQYDVSHLQTIPSDWWTPERCEKALYMVWSSPSLEPIRIVLEHCDRIPIELFETAVRHGRIDHVQLALTYGMYDLHDALRVAILSHQDQMVRFLLQFDHVWVHHRDLLGWLAAHGERDGLERLCRFTNNDVYIVLEHACRYAQWEIVQWMMEHTIIDWDTYGSIYLRYACRSGSVQFLEQLVPYITDYNPEIMLSEACRFGQEEAIEWWIKRGTPLKSKCIKWAIESGHLSLVQRTWTLINPADVQELACYACRITRDDSFIYWMLDQPSVLVHQCDSLLYRIMRPFRSNVCKWMVERFVMTPDLIVGTNRLDAVIGYYRLPYDVRKYISSFLVPTFPRTWSIDFHEYV